MNTCCKKEQDPIINKGSQCTIIVKGNAATLKSLGIKTFNGCTGLTEIICRAITPPTAKNTGQFTNVPTGIPVYVPAESVDAYKASDLWGIFTNIQAIQQ